MNSAMSKQVSRWLFLSIALIACAPGSLYSQQATEYEVKAAFLYNFTRFVAWPPANQETQGSLVIGVLGECPLNAPLQQATADQIVDGRRLEVRTGSSLQQLGEIDVLFISLTDREAIRSLLQSLEGRPVLTVSDHPEFTALGGVIRFFIRDRRVAFEINQTAAETSGLKISSRLLSLAVLYREGDRSSR
jgi:hypothetical protein